MMRRKILVFLMMLCGMFGVLLCASDTFAAVDNSMIIKKWFLTGYYSQCASSSSTPISADYINSNKNKYVKDAIFNKKIGVHLITPSMSLPSYNFAGVKSNKKIKCDEMFLGSDSTANFGLVNMSNLNNGVRWSDSEEDVRTFMTSLGYVTTGGGSKTIQITLAQAPTKVYQSSFSDDSLKLVPLANSIVYENNQYSVKGSSSGNGLFNIKIENGTIKFIASGMSGAKNEIEIKIKNTPEETIEEINKSLGDLTWTYINMLEYSCPENGCAALSGSGNGWEYKDTKTKRENAVKSMSGLSLKQVYWTKPERYTVYLHYLVSASKEIVCDPESVSNNLKQVKLKDNSGKLNKNCYVNFNGHEPKEYPVTTQSTSKLEIIGDNKNKKSTVTLQTVINWLNKATYSDKELAEMATIGELSKNDSEDNKDNPAPKTCANQGGAESLGWIVCPILEWLGNASTDAYEKYVEPSLRVDPQLFTGGNEGVRVGWENFRNIANVIFIILILAIIFSQLTGVGIDNYGIKKILPKLIVAAVLINLSYLICILLVDISNIAGNGLRMMFEGLPTNSSGTVTLDIPGALARNSTTPPTVNTGDGTLVTVGVLAALAVMVGVVWQNPAILLSLLVAALGVAISIFFLFILLSVREAGVIVMVVVSPLAVAAYMLPNTKKLFDKWWKLFQGLLLVYPICGLLVGGGNYISKLLLSAEFAGGGFLKAFTAMIVGIVPIFFIPTVLKSSFSAMGKVGGMLTGLGDRARKGATSGIRNSQGYKSAQTRSLERKNRLKAGVDKEGNLTARGKLKTRLAETGLGKAMGYQKLQAGRIAAAKKTREQDIESASELKDAAFKYDVAKGKTDQSTEDILRDNLEKAAAKGDTNEIFAVIEQMKRSNMQASHIANATREFLGGNGLNLSGGDRKNFLEEFAKKYSGDFLKKDFEQANWASKGGVGVAGAVGLGTRGEPGSWAIDNIEDLKDEEVAALSSENMAALIKAGKITSTQAQRVWASNGNMDDTSRLILGAYGNSDGRVQLSKAEAQYELNISQTPPPGYTRQFSEEQRKAYTEKAPEDVRIRDVNWRDSHGQHQQTDPMIVQQQQGHLSGNQRDMHDAWREQQGEFPIDHSGGK